MTGVLLCGGNGVRLRPLTYVANKHLLPVFDKPMCFYPIKTLKDMGCDEIIIITGGEHIGGFASVLKDGSDFGVRFTYRIQPEAGGIAQALGCVEGLVDGVFPVILGDNFFSESPPYYAKPTLYLKEVPDPQRFGVYHKGKIIEKPTEPLSNEAVTGLYVYNESVFNFIKTLKPSDRGELEVTDINNWYLQNDCLVCSYQGKWSDLGTFDSLLEVANYIKENR